MLCDVLRGKTITNFSLISAVVHNHHNMKTLSALAAFLLLFCVVVATTEASVAADANPKCQEWAEQGECENNPDYMLVSCATSCQKASAAVEEELKDIHSFFDLKAYDIDGKLVAFDNFLGKVTILTNVASYCGYTAEHYKQLVELWSHVKNDEVEILAFPCNQFGAQEPGTAEEIKKFAQEKGVRFRMMQKIKVNGPEADTVYKFLKREAGPKSISWNFATYYVAGPDGKINSFSGVEPMSLKSVALGLLRTEL